MKIAHIVCTFPPYHGGMGNVVYQTVSELSTLGHEVEVLTPMYYAPESPEMPPETPEDVDDALIFQEQKKAQKELDITARQLKPRLQKGNAAYIPQIKKELDDFDLVHLHYPFYGVANLVRKWKLRNPQKPLVITYHMDNRGPGFMGLFFKYYAKFWMPRILNSADALIASSFDYIESSNASSIYKQNPEKWHEMPFGVDLENFKPREKKEALFVRHNLNKDLPIVLFVGGMDEAHYFKGIPVLLKALRLMKKNDTPVQVVLVGEGNLREQFEFEAKGLGVGKLVHFVGKISQEELPYYYNLADLFVLPSVNTAEAFGMVLLESMASGVPVVASDLPGVRTVASDGGVVVPPNNPEELAKAIVGYFIKNNEGLSSQVRKIAEEKYNWGPITQELSELYTQLAKKVQV